MSETANYGLYITDDSSETFFNWRTKMNGTENSNMTKIDTALNDKAKKSNNVLVTLLSTAWSGASAPFTQIVSVDGLGANQNAAVSVAHTATAEQRNVSRNAMLSVTAQAEGSITISADGEMPDIDIPVLIILFG